MVTKEEFGQLIAEFESFRDMSLEEFSKMRADLEEFKEQLDDILKELRITKKKL